MAEDTDRRIVEEMWTVARNEPTTLASISPFGFVDMERYRRRVGDIVLTFTLDRDPKTNIWAYELRVQHEGGEPLDDETVQYWLQAFFGRNAFMASRRNFLLTGEASYTFPYSTSS